MDPDASPSRRRYLRTAGATALAASLAGCWQWGDDEGETTRPGTTARGPGPTNRRETTEPGATRDEPTTDENSTEQATQIDREEYRTVVNVADAGADVADRDASAADADRINDVLESHVGDDTLLYFPPGRYRLGEWVLVDHDHLAVVGDNAVLQPPAGESEYWLAFDDLRDFTFAGFELDCRARNTAPVNHVGVSGGTSVVRDVSLRGFRTVPHNGFEVAATARDAELRLERVRAPDGAADANGIGLYAFSKSVGTLVLEDCRVENWGEGTYVSPHSGPLRVLGGYYANNGIDQIRVGGGPNGAVVRGATVRVDDPQQPRDKPNMRGIWMEEGAFARIVDCDVAITRLDGTYSSGGIVVGRQFGAATVENTRVRTDPNVPAVTLRHPVDSVSEGSMPSMDELPDHRQVVCRNLDLAGAAGAGSAVEASRRDGCTFEHCCVRYPGGSRDGFVVDNATDWSIRNSTVVVGGETVRTRDATVETTGVRRDGDC